MLPRSLAAFALAVLLPAGCQWVAGIEERPQTRFAEDASDAGAPDAAGWEASCSQYPAKPDNAPSPEGGDIEFTVALRTIDFGTEGSSPGFDLDGVVTECGDAGTPKLSCNPPNLVTASCDGTCGVDHGGNSLLYAAENFTKTVQALMSYLHKGNIGLVFRVKSYNGQADDPYVVIDVFLSGGTCVCADSLIFCQQFDAGAEACDDDGGVGVRWDGTDLWAPVTGPAYLSAQKVFSKHAMRGYVRDNVLVATQDDAALDPRILLAMGISGARLVALPLSRPVLSARIENTVHGFRLKDGRLAGAASTGDLLNLVASIGHCGDTVFNAVSPLMCSMRDIMADRAQDSKNAGCDALALGFAFTAEPAQLRLDLLPEDSLAKPVCEAGVTGCP